MIISNRTLGPIERWLYAASFIGLFGFLFHSKASDCVSNACLGHSGELSEKYFMVACFTISLICWGAAFGAWRKRAKLRRADFQPTSGGPGSAQ
jgi:hypothetical protein